MRVERRHSPATFTDNMKNIIDAQNVPTREDVMPF